MKSHYYTISNYFSVNYIYMLTTLLQWKMHVLV